MRIFRFIFLIPALLCTTGAMADACWEIKKCSGNTCQLSARSDTTSDSRYFQCGGNGGCANGAIIYALSEYYKCGPNKWVKLDKDKLSDELSNVRECGDSNADNENTAQVWVDNDTYDFFRENKSDTFLDKSDICKKTKSDKVKKTQEKPPAAVNSDANPTIKEIENEAPQQVEQPVEKDAPKPAQVQNNITISGTVFDNTNSPIPQVNIVVVGNETYGVAADDNGRYTINGLSADSKLKFSSIGFKPVEKTVADLNDNPNVELTETAVGLQAVTISPCADDEKFEHGKCVKIKTAEPAKEPVVATEPTYEQKASTDETSYTPSADELAQKLKSAKDALAAAQGKENSWANRGVTAASSAMTGLGGMQLAEGIAERWADAEAEKEMRAYIETMKCNYGGGPNITLGNEEITLPGGNELLEYYTEYKTLADNLKTTKAALGLRAGIESEVLYDRAQSGLYQYSNAERQSGGETSLYRALTDTESTDATAWAAQKDEASQKLKVGGGVAAGGAAVGVIGNAAINTDMIQNIKDAFKK